MGAVLLFIALFRRAASPEDKQKNASPQNVQKSVHFVPLVPAVARAAFCFHCSGTGGMVRGSKFKNRRDGSEAAGGTSCSGHRRRKAHRAEYCAASGSRRSECRGELQHVGGGCGHGAERYWRAGEKGRRDSGRCFETAGSCEPAGHSRKRIWPPGFA